MAPTTNAPTSGSETRVARRAIGRATAQMVRDARGARMGWSGELWPAGLVRERLVRDLGVVEVLPLETRLALVGCRRDIEQRLEGRVPRRLGRVGADRLVRLAPTGDDR